VGLAGRPEAFCVYAGGARAGARDGRVYSYRHAALVGSQPLLAKPLGALLLAELQHLHRALLVRREAHDLADDVTGELHTLRHRVLRQQQRQVSRSVGKIAAGSTTRQQPAPPPCPRQARSRSLARSPSDPLTPLRCFGFEFFFVMPSDPVKRVTTCPLFSPAATPVFSNPPAAGISQAALQQRATNSSPCKTQRIATRCHT
jgi:hypothetical protein